MENVELWRIKQLAEASREAVWNIAKAHGYEPKIYLHWSAGKYNTPFADYHINILCNSSHPRTDCCECVQRF